jgi:hypothetical protein
MREARASRSGSAVQSRHDGTDALPCSAHVNLGFYPGAHLADLGGRLKGTGKAMRHLSLRHAGEVDDLAVIYLLPAAREERRRALGVMV